MNCAECGAPIADGQIGCRVCTERRSQQAVLEQQKSYLSLVFSGRQALTLYHPPAGVWHVSMLGHPSRAFCGAEIELGSRKKWRRLVRYYDDFPDGICGACWQTLDRLANQSREDPCSSA